MAELREPKLAARRGANEHEIVPPVRDNGEVQLGTVGWEDADESVDPGTPDNETSGVTLIRITLFSGKDPLEPHDPTRAQGTKILARNSAGEVVPAAGSQVVVVRPAGIDGPGAWHVVANPGAGAGPVLTADGGSFFRRKLDGSVWLGTTDDGTPNGRLIALGIKRDGFVIRAPWGKLAFDATGFHLLLHNGARIDLGGIGGLPSPLDVVSSYFSVSAGVSKLQSTAVALGPDAGAFDSVAHSTPLLSVLTAIDAALIAIGSGLSALGYAGAGAAVAAETAALATAAPLIPSNSSGAT